MQRRSGVGASLAVAWVLLLAGCGKSVEEAVAASVAEAEKCLSADTGGATISAQVDGSECAACCERVKGALPRAHAVGLGAGSPYLGVDGRCRCGVPVECPGFVSGQECGACCEAQRLYITHNGPSQNALVSAAGGSHKASFTTPDGAKCYCAVLHPATE